MVSSDGTHRPRTTSYELMRRGASKLILNIRSSEYHQLMLMMLRCYEHTNHILRLLLYQQRSTDASISCVCGMLSTACTAPDSL
jgi:hypothetical protein